MTDHYSKPINRNGKKCFEVGDFTLFPIRDYKAVEGHVFQHRNWTTEARLMEKLLIEWGKIPFDDAEQEDSAGRARVRRLRVNELVDMAETATKRFMQVAEANGWIVEAPDVGAVMRAAEFNSQRNQ